MKKHALILSLISFVGYGNNNLELKLKSDYTINNQSIKYVPVDMKLVNNKDNYTIFFKLRGGRRNIKYVDTVDYYYSDYGRMFDVEIKDPKNKETIESDELFEWWGGSKEHYHGPHEHDMALEEHDHMFDENISHEHDPNVIGNLLPIMRNSESIETALQPKVGIVYHPTKYSHLRLSYMPLVYDGDEKRYFNGIVVDGKYTKLFNDNLAFIIRPEITTEKGIKPAYLELRSDLRYKYDNNTVLSAYMYNGIQTKNIKDQCNILNSIELTYDYNTEKRRYHKFYEILDHDHEKIDQLKVSLRFAHNANYLKNPVNNQKIKFDVKTDYFETKLKANYKKTIDKLIF